MKVGFAYGIDYLIDTATAIIIDVAATPARWSAEVASTKIMLERVKDRFHLAPQRLATDAAYGSGLMIKWLMQRDIEPHIPPLDREHHTKGSSPAPNSALMPKQTHSLVRTANA
jgi:hypothetical protein